MNNFLLVIAALLPAIILCVYVFKKDRAEKEPIGLLIKLCVLGVLCCFPAAYFEGHIIDGIDALFSVFTYVDAAGAEALPKNIFYVYHFFKFFAGVALVEEGFKWLALLYATRKNKEFNSLFDGLIYAIFVSVGFAAFENVLYVLEHGWVNAIVRGVLSVPGHMFFAVLMGYHYSFWHIAEKAGFMEATLQREGVIPAGKLISGRKNMVLSIVMPVLAHGLYDYCCALGSGLGTIIFLVFVIGLYIHCFKKIRKMSVADAPEERYVNLLLLKKYPQLIARETTDVNENL